jgi:hypothetical protein
MTNMLGIWPAAKQFRVPTYILGHVITLTFDSMGVQYLMANGTPAVPKDNTGLINQER